MKKGLQNKYIIQKVSGERVSPAAEYFVLRLDQYQKDENHRYASCKAMQTYAKCVGNPDLAFEIEKKLEGNWNPSLPLLKPDFCMWTRVEDDPNRFVSYYDTSCGKIRVASASAVDDNFNFCPYCGQRIV